MIFGLFRQDPDKTYSVTRVKKIFLANLDKTQTKPKKTERSQSLRMVLDFNSKDTEKSKSYHTVKKCIFLGTQTKNFFLRIDFIDRSLFLSITSLRLFSVKLQLL